MLDTAEATRKAQITRGNLELAAERMIEGGDGDGNGSVGRGRVRGFMGSCSK